MCYAGWKAHASTLGSESCLTAASCPHLKAPRREPRRRHPGTHASGHTPEVRGSWSDRTSLQCLLVSGTELRLPPALQSSPRPVRSAEGRKERRLREGELSQVPRVVCRSARAATPEAGLRVYPGRAAHMHAQHQAAFLPSPHCVSGEDTQGSVSGNLDRWYPALTPKGRSPEWSGMLPTARTSR